MTRLTVLPYLRVLTHNATQCTIEHSCIDCFAEFVDVPVEDFDGEEAVTYYDADGKFVAAMLYDTGDSEPFEKSEYFVREIIVNVCGKRKLSDIVKDLCEYVTTVDDSFGDFNFSCMVDDICALLLQEICEHHSYSPKDKSAYFTYTV